MLHLDFAIAPRRRHRHGNRLREAGAREKAGEKDGSVLFPRGQAVGGQPASGVAENEQVNGKRTQPGKKQRPEALWYEASGRYCILFNLCGII